MGTRLAPLTGTVLVLGMVAAATGAHHTRASEGSGIPPNVLVVMTDDQTVPDMRVMPRVQRLIADRGTTFSNSFVNYPLCCPSRSTFLTGQYAHNHGVLIGNGFGSLDSSNTLPVWLQAGGYHTGHIGRYVPGYGFPDNGGPEYVPPGWSEWYAAPWPTELDVYDYDLNENGTLVHYGSSAREFKGTVLTRKAVDFIDRSAPASDPFFLFVAYTAPHGTRVDDKTSRAGCDNTAVPAPGDVGAFAGAPMPKSPSFGEPDVGDKPAYIRNLPPFDPSIATELTRRYRCRHASLRYVDRGVTEMVQMLCESGELDDTLIIFVSDNGYLVGEHRVRGRKVDPYEESIRVPTVMRGPGVPVDRAVSSFVVNADLAPTILDAAGAAPRRIEDGASLFDVISGRQPSRDVLIESYIDLPIHTPYAGIRTHRYAYIEYETGEAELYDLERDPYQLANKISDPDYVGTRDWLEARLATLHDCRGAVCRSFAGEPPPPMGPAGTSGEPCGACGAPQPLQLEPQPQSQPFADRDDPDTMLTKHPRRKVRSHKRRARVRFAFAATEPARFICRLDKRRWRRCRSPKRVRTTQGRHTFRVTAVDEADNRDAKPARWRWRVKVRHHGR